YEVKVLEQRAGIVIVEGKAKVNGQIVAKAKLMLGTKSQNE
ncbi:MAG TPA: 3-hydroxyacyl-[acyl-carrier-protein] dehydratase FabZ, partial [Fervidobacterium sp.]|nr:3-hydroxyacyl-[acyl-carrier-protein] dehydratase FabZ [Fervidobacterium sp.]